MPVSSDGERDAWRYPPVSSRTRLNATRREGFFMESLLSRAALTMTIFFCMF